MNHVSLRDFVLPQTQYKIRQSFLIYLFRLNKMPSIANISPELFVVVCSFLPPDDLFTLSQVCRKFREYLFAPNSVTTQQIWKESRLQFVPKENMSPPEGLTEEKYVELLMTERGCQICRKVNVKKCKIHWEFQVRCCEECLLKNIIR
jgi:hypothetical protein